MERIQLIIEAPAGQDHTAGCWGRLMYDNDLIVDQADSVAALQESMRQLLFDFHDLKEVEFELCYDLHSFFEHYGYLKISKVADYAGMNASLLRHYKAQTKFPSGEQVRRIESAVHQLAHELQQVHLVAA